MSYIVVATFSLGLALMLYAYSRRQARIRKEESIHADWADIWRDRIKTGR